MASVVFQVKLNGLDKNLAMLAKGLEEFPAESNPLRLWRADYGKRTRDAARPGVGASGMFRGNAWPALRPAYTRQDDTVVPVWGGVPRARAGNVTRAGSATIRFLKHLTPEQKRGFRGANKKVAKVGDKYTSGPVLGRLKRDGSRYRASDLQLGEVGKGTGLLTTFTSSAPIIENRGKRVTVTTNAKHAEWVHELRKFAWGGAINREEQLGAEIRVGRYLSELMRRLSK